jgi:hypothetical protein
MRIAIPGAGTVGRQLRPEFARPEVRRVIYTTNLIESMNARLRKVTRNRGQFPSEQAALKVLYLAVRNLEEFRSPNTGIRSSGRKQALQTVGRSRQSPRRRPRVGFVLAQRRSGRRGDAWPGSSRRRIGWPVTSAIRS